MHTEKVGVFIADRTEIVGAFRAEKLKTCVWGGGLRVAHVLSALIWKYPRGSYLDVYSLSRIYQQLRYGTSKVLLL